MDVDSPSRPSREEVRIRVAPAVALATNLPLVAIFVIPIGAAALVAGSKAWIPWPLLIVSGVAASMLTLGLIAPTVTLTSRELVMRGVVRRRVPWSDVVAITQTSCLGSRSVRLSTRDGRPRVLHAPQSEFGVGRRRFDKEFAVLEQWWLAHTDSVD